MRVCEGVWGGGGRGRMVHFVGPQGGEVLFTEFKFPRGEMCNTSRRVEQWEMLSKLVLRRSVRTGL